MSAPRSSQLSRGPLASGLQPPNAVSDTYWVEAFSQYAFNLPTTNLFSLRPIDNDSDPQGESISLSAVSAGTYGQTAFSSLTGRARYVPTFAPLGSTTPLVDNLTYGVKNTSGLTSIGAMTLNILPSQDTSAQVQHMALQRGTPANNGLDDCVVTSDGNVFAAGFSDELVATQGIRYGLMYSTFPTGSALTGLLNLANITPGGLDLNWTNVLVRNDRVYYVGLVPNGPKTYLYITGYVANESAPSYSYARSYNGVPKVVGAKLDPAGNLIIATDDGVNYAEVRKLNFALKEGKLVTYEGPSYTTLRGIGVGADNSVYVAGSKGGDCFAQGLDKYFATRWTSRVDQNPSDTAEALRAVTVGKDGAPVFVGSGKFGNKSAVYKLKATDGALLWEKNVSNATLSTSWLGVIASTADGVVVGGVGQRGHPVGFLAKLTSAGQIAWNRIYDSPTFGASGQSEITQVATESTGGIYAAGTAFDSGKTTSEMFLLAFGAEGNRRWTRTKRSVDHQLTTPPHLAVNDAGRVAVAFSAKLGNFTEAMMTIIDQTPIPMADSYSAEEYQTLTVKAPGPLSNDAYATGREVVLAEAPSQGLLKLSPDGSFTYLAPASTTGPQSFKYFVRAPGLPASRRATVTLNVTPSANGPIPAPDVAEGYPGVPVTIPVLANDTDPGGLPLTIIGVSDGTKGTSVFTGKKVVYTARPDASGVDVFSYKVSNGTRRASSLISVTLVPDPTISGVTPETVVANSATAISVRGHFPGPGTGWTASWNGVPRATTTWSPTKITFGIEASEVPTEGAGAVSVTNPGGRVSNELSVVVRGRPTFTGKGTRLASSFTLELTLKNTGTAPARNLLITASNLNGSDSTSALPLLGEIPIGASKTFSLEFPAAVFTGLKGKCVLKYSFDGGAGGCAIVIPF